MPERTAETRAAIEAVWRVESARLIAGLARFVRDVGKAEDLAHDALVAALEQWPDSGIPRNPGAWLMAAGKNRALDLLRHRKVVDRKHILLQQELEEQERAMPGYEEVSAFGDDLLRLIFVACHPILPRESQVALTLRLLGGLTTDEIARAFLVSESTLAQRLVRAKKTLSRHRIAFEVPVREEILERLPAVLEVIYLIFNEGYSATSGDVWIRKSLSEEAIRLGRVLSALVPNEAEPHALLSLMELQSSRFAARVGPAGEPVLLLDQNRTKWDWRRIERGMKELRNASALGNRDGIYYLQAAIAACHASARHAAMTDWPRIAGLYDVLCQTYPSPTFELGRSVAVGMARGPTAALDLLDKLSGEPSLLNSHRLPSVRGEFLFKLKRFEEAYAEFQHAAVMALNTQEKNYLILRGEECLRSHAREAIGGAFT